MVDSGFLKQPNRNLVIEIEDPSEAIETLKEYEFDEFSIWDKLDRDKTHPKWVI